MTTKNITFDPDSGVAKGANLTIHTGTDFVANFNVSNTANSAFDLTGYTGSSAMSKSVSIGATLGITTSFAVGFTSAYDGKFKISLGSTATRSLSEGRYIYDVLISSGSTVYSIVNGNILVIPVLASQQHLYKYLKG